jgi:CRP/FNR family cyclic AMP-dependent transcriptional regulator
VKLLDTLRRNPFLSMLTEAEIENLLKRAVRRNFAKGKAVYHKGDAVTGFFVVLSGHVATSLASVDGTHRPFRMYGPGDALGEISMLEGKSRITSALAMEDASLKFVSRRDFEALLARRPDLAVQIISYLCARFRRLHNDFDSMLTLDMPAKVARVILHLHQSFALPDKGKLPSLRLSQGEIAAMLGLSREWVGRELVKWRKAGIIELSRKRLVIRDRPALERILVKGGSKTNRAHR